MSVKALLNGFINSPRLFQLADRLSFSQTQKIYLENLRGSSPEFFSAAIFEHPSCSQFNHLIVLNDAEEAAYFHNTLENLTGALDIFYFPSSFKNRKNFRLLNSSHVMLRTEALTKIAAGGNKKILVTYPEALFEKVVVPSTLSSNIIHIKAGDSLNVEQLLLKLADYGFERTDFVYEPGQFAIRGGILDIYSFGNEKPYRIELFGNGVDSIRIVDPETQLSERKLLQVSIIPNVETQFEEYEKIAMFDFLPENTILWFQDYDICKARIDDYVEDLDLFLLRQEELKKNQPVNDKKSKAHEEEENRFLKKDISANDYISALAFEE